MKKIKKAIIPAAGLGTRFLPATKAQPKEMLPIVDKPTLQYIIEEAIASGIEEILIITGRNKQSIENHFDKSVELEMELEKKGKTELLEIVREISDMVNIHYIRQKEPLGLGHAIYCAKTFVQNEPFAVLLGDDIVDSEVPCLAQLIKAYEECNSTVLGVQRVRHEDVYKYGIIDTDDNDGVLYKVNKVIEKPNVDEAPTDIAILGRYILTPDIFNVLEKQAPGAGGEIQLTDGIETLLEQQHHIYAYEFEGNRYDVGDKLGYLKATIDFALKKDELCNDLLDYLNKTIDRG